MRSLATLVVFAAAPFLAGAAPVEKPSPAACALAREVVTRTVLGHPLPGTQIVAPFAKPSPTRDRPPLTPHRGGEAPPPELEKAFFARGEESVLACADVRKLLDEGGVPYGAEAEARVRPLLPVKRDLSAPSYAIHYISLPVMSANGREALVSVGQSCTGLCGSTFTYYYRKGRDGRWTANPVGTFSLS